MKKKERRAMVTGAPMFGGGLSALGTVAFHAFNGGTIRARVLVCVCVCPSIGRYSLCSLVSHSYVRTNEAVRGLLAIGALVNDRGRLTVTDVGIREIEALANDLLGNVERLRLKVSLQRFGRPDLLSFGMDEK